MFTGKNSHNIEIYKQESGTPSEAYHPEIRAMLTLVDVLLDTDL